MILWNTLNLNSAFVVNKNKKGKRQREKSKRKLFPQVRSSFEFIPIPFDPVGFDFIPKFRSIKWKWTEKSIGQTDIIQEACFVEK